MAKRTNVLITHNSTTANEPDSQNNCSVCPPFSRSSLQFVKPVINSFADDLSVKILPAGAHSVIGIINAGNRSAIHVLLQSLHAA